MPSSTPFSGNNPQKKKDLNSLDSSNKLSSVANSGNQSGSRKLSFNLKVASFVSAAVLAGLTVFGLSGVILSTFSADNKPVAKPFFNLQTIDMLQNSK